MAYCINCGTELYNGAKFCGNCGNAVSGSAQRKIVYEGDIHKCPNCGENVEAFVSKCSTCGYEIRGSKNSSAFREFAEKLEQVEMQRVTKNGVFEKGEKGEGLGKIHPIDEQKISLIRSFAIPNTKEDIYEVMILAATNIDTKLYNLTYHGSQFQGMLVASQKAVSDAWLAKFEQAYQKAKLVFGDNSEFMYLENLYNQKTREIKWEKWKYPLFIVGGFLFIFLIIVLYCLFFSTV